MSDQVEQTYKEQFAQRLQLIKEASDGYRKEHRELFDTSREAVKSLFNQMRQWLLPFALKGLLHVRLENIICFKELFGEFETQRVIIKLSDNRSITVELYALNTTVACSHVRIVFVDQVSHVYYLAWHPKRDWYLKGYPFDNLPVTEETFFKCLEGLVVIKDESKDFW